MKHPYLLHQKPEDIREWIQGSMDSSMLTPENFNWLGLAQGATSKAESLAGSKPEFLVQAIQWARVGVMIYEYLLDEKSNLYDRNSLAACRREVSTHRHEAATCLTLMGRVCGKQ